MGAAGDAGERGRLVVVGGGLAGLRAVEAARRAGHTGPVTWICAERHPAYDRPPLSKQFLTAGRMPEPTYLERSDALTGLGVDSRQGVAATGLDTRARTVDLDTGERVQYDALVIASGARPRTLPARGGLEGVLTLRTLEDARRLRREMMAGSRRAVVVGAGFVGLEVAGALRRRRHEVTVVEAADRPVSRAVDARGGALVADLAVGAGTRLLCGTAVTELDDERGRVCGVGLSDGVSLEADLVVVGIGTVASTDWLATSGLAVRDGVLCDGTMSTSVPGVFAAGDVARVTSDGGPGVRTEHWTAASEQGQLAGSNAAAYLAGHALRSTATVPYVWSDLFGHRVQLLGRSTEDALVVGGPRPPWIVLYSDGTALCGALAADLPHRIMKLRPLVQRRAGLLEAAALARDSVR